MTNPLRELISSGKLVREILSWIIDHRYDIADLIDAAQVVRKFGSYKNSCSCKQCSDFRLALSKLKDDK